MKKHVLFLLIIFWWHLSATGQSTSERSGDNPFYGFIENRGQIIDQNQEINNSVRYLLNRPGFNLQLKNNSFSYDTYEKTGAIDFAFHRVDIVLQNANPNPTIIASGEANDVINYYYPHIAVSGVKHFENIIYKDIYPQIDLEFFLTEVDGKNWFEYQFIIHPGGRIQDIVLDYQGEKSISLQEEKIIIEVNQGSFHEFIPLSYLQESKEKVDVKFMLDENQQISFILETDVNWIDEDGICMNTLVIDPTPMVSWSTYYGGVGDEGHSSIGVSGTNVCLTGTTTSSNPGNIISTQGASPFNNISGGIDGYLAMFTTGGSRMWGTYYGGTGDDYITGVVNTGNDVYVCGYTNSTGLIGSGGLATSGAYATANAGGNDMFIARFNSVASGSHVWGTYYGGAGDDKATDIVLSGSDLYISGYSNSSPGVSMGAVFQSVKSNSYDATLLKMNTAGTPSLCTFYGGNGDDYGNSVKVNAGASTEVWVCGTTSSTNLITTTGPATNSGGTDIFVFRTNTLLNTLTTSRYFGGAGNETGEDLAATVISAVSRIYVIGTTNSSGLGTAGTFKPNYSNNGSEAIVVNFSNTGIVNWASYYGDEEMNWSDDQGTAIDINNAGTLIIGGNTAGSNVQLNNYISYPNAIQTGRVDYRDCFLARLNYLNGTRIFGTFYASTGDDYLTDISVSSTCNFYATGVVNSGGGLWNNGAGPGYATSGAYQTGNASDGAWLTQFTAADSVSAYIAPISPSICSGASVNLSASGGVSYNWSTFESSSTISVSPATTTTYTVTVTSACGGTATASVTVTVSSTPPTATAGNDGPKCVGQTLLLNSSGGSSYSWSGPNGFLSSSQNPSISNIQLLNGGVYTVTVTDANGCTATATTSVTVNANPTVSISGTTTICNGQSTSLTASGGGTYLWNTSETNNAISVNPATNTTYTVTVTGANGCTATASQLVTVNANPTASISGTTTICNGQSTSLTASGGGTYLWNTSETNNAISVNPATNTTYTVTVTGANGCTATASQLVTVNANPTASISGTTTICNGQSTSLTASGGGTYLWNTSETNNAISVNPATNTTYTVTVTGANGCTATASQLVTVNANPTASISGTTTICNGQSTSLTASGGGTYLWNTSETNNAISVNPATNTTYTVTVTGANGCTATASQLVTVNANPTASISGTTTICNGQSTSLTASGGGTYLWNTSETNNAISVNPATNTTYTVTVTGANGCTATASQLVTVNANPTASISGTTTICNGQSTSLTASGGGTYLWNTSETNNAISVNPATNTTYTVTVTGANGCTATASQLVTVNANPTASISGTTTICNGQSTSLTASGGGTYLWNTSETNNAISVNPATNTTYTVTVTGANGCTATASQLVTVNANPTASAFNNGPLCVGSNLSLTSSPNLMFSYSWSGPSGFTSSNQNPSINNITLAEAGTYTVTITDNNGCSASSTTSVTVTNFPSVNINVNPSATICLGESVTLTSTTGVAYIWDGGQTTNSISVSPSSQTTYTVTVTDPGGCAGTASASITINVNPLPTPSISINGLLCDGEDVVFNAMPNGMITYNWSGPNSFSSTQQNPTISNANSINSGLYTLTITANNGCSNSIDTTITINNSPSIIVANSGPVCSGDTLYLNCNPSGYASYNWSGPNSFSSTNQNTYIFPSQNTSSGIYTITVTDINGCTSSTNTSATVNPLPNVSFSNDTTICEGDSVLLHVTSNGNITWYDTSLNTIGTGSQLNTGVLLSDAMYYIISSLNGCEQAGGIDSILINVISQPVVSDYSNDTSICAGNYTTLNVNTSSNVSWYDMTGNLIGTGNTFTTPTLNSSTQFIFTAGGGSCIQSGGPDTININVIPLPVVSLISGGQIVCPGDDALLIASSNGVIEWYSSVGILISMGDSLLINNITDTTLIMVTAQNQGCYMSGSMIPAIIIPNYNSQILLMNDTITVVQSTSGTLIQVTNNDISYNEIQITSPPSHGTAQVIGINIQYTPNASFTGNDSLQYISCDTVCGICDTAWVYIKVINALFIPQLITPNDDGKNDYFHIVGLELYPNNQLTILNRWGDIIYVADPYMNDWKGQSNTGLNITGNAVTDGTYFFVLLLTPDSEPIKGFIELKKK